MLKNAAIVSGFLQAGRPVRPEVFKVTKASVKIYPQG